MQTLLLLCTLSLEAQAQDSSPAAHISRENHEAVLREQIAKGVVDQPIKASKVKPGDIVIIPAGTPHSFSELDGPISYLVYRFEPK